MQPCADGVVALLQLSAVWQATSHTMTRLLAVFCLEFSVEHPSNDARDLATRSDVRLLPR